MVPCTPEAVWQISTSLVRAENLSLAAVTTIYLIFSIKTQNISIDMFLLW